MSSTNSVDSLLSLLKAVRSQDPNVQRVCIEQKRLPGQYIEALLNAIAKSRYVRKLVLRKVGADDSVAAAVAACITHSLHLTDIDLGKNRFTACREIASALRGENCKLRRLNLESNQMDDEGVMELCAALANNTSLTCLKIGKNKFGRDGVESIATLLANNTTLTSVDMRSNSLGDEGAAIVADALTRNRSLQYLYLNRNGIANEGAEYLAGSLQQNKHLRTLDLQRNTFDDDGASKFAETLSDHNHSFTKLKIRNTSVSEEAKDELLDLLLMNTHGPDLARRTKVAMTELLADNTTQEEEYECDEQRDDVEEEASSSSCSDCVICFDQASNCVLLPCMHSNCCAECSKQLTGCHMCRSAIVKVLPMERKSSRTYC